MKPIPVDAGYFWQAALSLDFRLFYIPPILVLLLILCHDVCAMEITRKENVKCCMK